MPKHYLLHAMGVRKGLMNTKRHLSSFARSMLGKPRMPHSGPMTLMASAAHSSQVRPMAGVRRGIKPLKFNF